MGRKIRSTLLSLFTSVVLLACFTLHLYRLQLHGAELRTASGSALRNPSNGLRRLSFAIREGDNLRRSRSGSSISDSQFDSILLPDWEVLLVSSPEESRRPDDSNDGYNYRCVFQKKATSPAKFVGTLPSGNRAAFKCVIPISVRHLQPVLSPILTKSPGILPVVGSESPPEMLRWSFLAYESLSTEDDVILFVKGVNNRQGFGRSPDTLRCVFFTDDVNDAVIRTAVTSSTQEVFRCEHPNEPSLRRLLSNGSSSAKIRVSLELQGAVVVNVPSVALYYAPRRTIAENNTKSLLCACTMVHNVAKFLKEWVMFHSKLGVEKFLLYDNDSSDDLQKKVEELVINGGFNVEIVSWPWPKTQEAGFSHSAIYARDSCSWMMYLDVDEFVFSPSWLKSPHPSNNMLKSLLPRSPTLLSDQTGQVMIKCLEFGPSRQKSHPREGVIQGYTCRRRSEQRHKSIVLLSAIDSSLRNVVHHFKLREGYKGRTLTVREGVVNHYKYQAWSEFKEKFRRRVSTYVVDWTREEKPGSKDRTPGLGFEAVEPEGWADRFCEVTDDRLKALAQRWFGSTSTSSTLLN